jgi:hypothetical protein
MIKLDKVITRLFNNKIRPVNNSNTRKITTIFLKVILKISEWLKTL